MHALYSLLFFTAKLKYCLVHKEQCRTFESAITLDSSEGSDALFYSAKLIIIHGGELHAAFFDYK